MHAHGRVPIMHRHNRSSVGLLSDDVAAGLVAADDEDAAVVAADDARAANAGGGAPDNLRVVAADLAVGAAVSGV